MPIVVVFDLPGMTQAHYEKSLERMSGRSGPVTSPSDWPVTGLLSHTAAPTDNGWLVVDVWESQEEFDQFGETILPILRELGVPDARPKIYPLFSQIVG
ncbi:hypothetical protein [Streptomyces sp. NBC_00102]|uniref:hypothetical protein n=1 Tax=Streptomyces sp. NBC_00102 TaxID=2975652 RepID=UPI0022529A44|nr:hypothetical protein [Streptomyces sp. NBC_00102]MCX5399450.1 hypothetical protein [Streptomyces sp. NBC_00102]